MWLTDKAPVMLSKWTSELTNPVRNVFPSILGARKRYMYVSDSAIVLWLLAFHLHRNAFSVYVLNLSCADFLQICTQFVHSLQCFLKILMIYYHFILTGFMIA